MKRYSERMIYGDGCSEFDDGEYVLFTDAQADKHAALKELAAEVLPLIHGRVCDDNECFACEKWEAMLAKLRALTEPTP
jgi:hypothetical protein